MAGWRALEEYSPFARVLVDYMWDQRPPLVPNQFAARMDVRKQALSTWLNGDTVPAPPVIVRLARAMELPVRQLMTAAGYAPAHDPLLDRADAWAYVYAAVEQALDEADRVLDGGIGGDAVGAEGNAEGNAADSTTSSALSTALPTTEVRAALLAVLRDLRRAVPAATGTHAG